MIVATNLKSESLPPDGGAMKEVPEFIGSYKILEKLGEGGFATVYLAHLKDRDESQSVALKVLNARENYARFQREIETVAKLNHPNIIRIYDTGEDQKTGNPFFSMEYIPSGTLHDKLDTEYRLPRSEAIDIIKQVGNALTYPHQQGVIHRDVNPRNILLDTRHQPTRSVLTDFGLVKPLETEGSKLTKTIALIGTFAYYAPEQWNKEELGPATDIYALAITFFEMLSGQRPFRGDVFSLREKHLHETLPPLSSLAPEIGSFFDEVLIKATAKNPPDRYRTMASFIETIEEANEKAEQAATMARQKRAIEAIQIAQDRMQQSSYPLDEILEIIDTALEDYPGYGEALRLKGKMKLDQGQFLEALEDYKQAYEQGRDPSSAAGLDYLHGLKQAAEYNWQNQAYKETVKYFNIIKQVLGEDHDDGFSIQAWQEVWSDLVKAHYDTGVEAIAIGGPENIAEISNILEPEIEALEALGVPDQAQAFRDKLTVLQVKIYYESGIEAYAEGDPEDISQAIVVLERETQALEKLNAEQEYQDLSRKLKMLHIRDHYDRASSAFVIRDFDNAVQIISTLEREVEALDALGAQGEAKVFQNQVKALQINVYYKKGIEAYAEGNPVDIGQAIVVLERETQALEKLNAEQEYQDLYSKLKALLIKDHYDKAIRAYNERNPEDFTEAITILSHEIKVLEALEAFTESERLQVKLTALQVKMHYEAGNKAYADGKPEDIAEAVEILQQEVQSLQALDAEAERQELDEQLNLLQAKKLKTEKYDEIRQLIDGEQYAEALVHLDKEFIHAGHYEYRDVAKLFWQLVYAKQHEGEFPSERSEKSSPQPKLERQHEINRYLIPLSLLIAVVVGGIIAPQLQQLPGLSVFSISIIAWVLFIAYFAYYIKVYYLDR